MQNNDLQHRIGLFKTNTFKPLLLSCVIAFFGMLLMASCTKKTEAEISVTTKEVTDITESSAKTGGSVTSTGYSVGDCGVCYGESHNPSLNNSFTKDHEGDGSFSSTLSNLKSGTKYYVRAYAKMSSGIEYGDETSFTTKGGYTINVFANPTAGGTVTGAGTYQQGQSCTVTATAKSGYNFTKWTENSNLVSSDASYSFTVTGSKNLEAHFDVQCYTISASAMPSSAGIVTGIGAYPQGQSCTLTAKALYGYTFDNWTEDGNEVSTDPSYTFTVSNDRILTANFTYQGVGTVPTGAINGVFSVSASQYVFFSQGNLQYQASTNTWRFAEEQYDYMGEANSNISSYNSGWIDLFGWGTSGWSESGATYYQPWSKDMSDASLYGPPGSQNLTGYNANADWGVYNKISNGGNTTNTWRTMTKNEWDYVFNTRATITGIRYAKAQVNGVCGVILLPDNWISDYYSLSDTNVSSANYSTNVISSSIWENNLEAHGAVFMPAAGKRQNTSVYNLNDNGYYWATSYGNNNNFGESYRYMAYHMCVYNTLFNPMASDGTRSWGMSVRLVCPVE